MSSQDEPLWDREGKDWPNRAASRFIKAGGLRWHVQVAGEGPVLLLLHGTGGATHSWAGMLPLLAKRFRVVAPDLPGHGFTQAPAAQGLSLPGMGRLVAQLLKVLEVRPVLVAGHSAGAAILMQMAVVGLIAPREIIALNGALMPFGGMAGQVFSPLAQLLVRLPPVPWLLSRQAQDRTTVERLLRGTGSTVSPAMLHRYGALFRTRRHVGAALGMMAGWDLHALQRALPKLRTPVLLVVGDRDGFVPPSQAKDVQRLLPHARIVMLPRLGHLAHEEKPAELAALIAAEWPLNDDAAAEHAA